MPDGFSILGTVMKRNLQIFQALQYDMNKVIEVNDLKG